MNLELYLLSIIDNISDLFVPAITSAIIFGIVAVILFCISFDKDVNEEFKTNVRKLANLVKNCVIVAVFMSVLCSLVPTRDDIVKAYMIQEGAKLVTAKNADKAVEEFTKRLDKVIEHFTEGK